MFVSLHACIPARPLLFRHGTNPLTRPPHPPLLPPQAPFAAIHVGAAAPTVPPALLEQLSPNGIMVIPVGARDEPQVLQVIRKDASGRATTDTVCSVRYVPLCDLSRQVDVE